VKIFSNPDFCDFFADEKLKKILRKVVILIGKSNNCASFLKLRRERRFLVYFR
jgi:hypothetical protein